MLVRRNDEAAQRFYPLVILPKYAVGEPKVMHGDSPLESKKVVKSS